MNKIIMFLHFSPLYPLKGRFTTKLLFMNFVIITPLRGQGVMYTIKLLGQI